MISDGFFQLLPKFVELRHALWIFIPRDKWLINMVHGSSLNTVVYIPQESAATTAGTKLSLDLLTRFPNRESVCSKTSLWIAKIAQTWGWPAKPIIFPSSMFPSFGASPFSLFPYPPQAWRGSRIAFGRSKPVAPRRARACRKAWSGWWPRARRTEARPELEPCCPCLIGFFVRKRWKAVSVESLG